MTDTSTHTHYVFSSRMGAWWGKNSIYTSDVKDAKTYTREEAIRHCRTRFGSSGLGDFPVSIEDVNSVVKK